MASMSKLGTPSSLGGMRFLVRVAKSSSGVRKLWTSPQEVLTGERDAFHWSQSRQPRRAFRNDKPGRRQPLSVESIGREVIRTLDPLRPMLRVTDSGGQLQQISSLDGL